MTPELEKETIVSVVTALFTGIPAVLLVWWTWKRDQERLIVQKRFPDQKLVAGKLNDVPPGFGILIRNRSLYSVRISAVGFAIDGTIIHLTSDPLEIPIRASLTVPLSAADRPRVATALLKAATKHGVSIEEFLNTPKVVAMAALESGKQFTSAPFFKRLFLG